MKHNYFKHLFTALLLLCSTVAMAHDFETDGIYYTITDAANKTVAVSYKGDAYLSYTHEYSGSVVIPKIVYNRADGVYYGVTSIGDGAFYACGGLTSITIPGSVTSIGNNAFYFCSGLTSVTIPGSVTSIGDEAFSNCRALTSVTIPNSVTTIGSYAFYSCSGLTSVTIPSSVTSIGYGAFRRCGLTSVTIPGSVTSIGDEAFAECSRLKSVTIPGSVTSIGSYAFYDCSALTSVTIPSSVTSIGECAFEYCSGLTSVEIPGSVTSIGSYAFYLCRGLTSVTIPGSVTTIGTYAFDGCSGLTSVTIGDGVTSIGKGAFSYCDALTSVTIPSSVTSIGDYAFDSCPALTSITIPSSVTSIGVFAFAECSGLTSVAIGNGVTSIGNYAFDECTALKAVINFSNLSITKGSEENGMVAYYADKVINLPDGSIEGEFVFRNIDNVNVLAVYFGNETNIVLPDNYKGENYVIGNTAFKGCSAITSVTIPGCVTSIENNAFDNCTSLKDLHIEDGTETLTLGYNFNEYSEGLFYDCPLETLYLGRNLSYQADYPPFHGKSTLTSVSIGNCVTSIRAGVFNDCSGLTAVYISDLAAWCGIDFGNFSANPLYYAHKLYLNGNLVKNLNIPEGVTRIGYCAFYGCSAITSVTIPGSVTTIGTYAFDGCSGLTSVTIGNGVTSIGTGVFGGCSGLTSISIPGSVTSIGDRAFSGCTRIKEVHINDLAAWCGISFGPASNPCFHSAANLYLNGELATNLNIPMGVTSIGNNAFKGCSAITSVTIPSSLTSIGETVFSDCSGLTSISIPGSVTSIGNGVFDNCTSLKDLRIEDGNEVLTLGKNSKSGKGLFYDSPLNTLYLGRNLSYQADKSSGYSPFYGKSTLASVTIGNCVTSIEADAFKGCSGLTAVYISDLAAWCGISFGNFDANPLSCAHNLYLNEELVTNLNIPDGVTSIKESLFEDCTSLVSVEIPGSVTNIGNRAFSDCSGLAKVIISDGVTSIGEGAFFNCTGLESVYVWSETPPTLGSYAFYDAPTTVTLYVPSGTKKTYSAADGWSDFTNIEEMSGDFELVVTAAGYATLYLDYAVEIPEGVEVYTANAVDGDRLKMLPVEGVIPANTGVIVKADASTYTFNVVGYSVPAIESNLFRGSVENENVKLLSGQVAYVLSMVNGEVGMYRAELKDGAFLNNANKAYLLLVGNNVGVHDKEFDTSTGGQLSNGYRFDFGGITGISEVSDEVKGENGEVKTVYDLQGRKVENPDKGIYIIDGKKVWIK